MEEMVYMFTDVDEMMDFVGMLDSTTMDYVVEGYKSGFFKYYSVQVFPVRFDVMCEYDYKG